MMRSTRLPVALSVLALLSVSPCTAAESASAARHEGDRLERPNIILIVLDTFRADRLGRRSGKTSLTPFLDAFSRHALVFRRAMSPADVTSESHFSMLTGYPPSAFRTAIDVPSLSVVSELNAAGYDTIGFSANAVVDPATMACIAPFQTFLSSPYVQPVPVPAELFDRVVRFRISPTVNDSLDANLGKLLASAEAVNSQLETLLETCEPGKSRRPLFLFLNFMDVHDPYVPPGSFGPPVERLWEEWPVNGDIRSYPIQGNNPRGLRQVQPYMYADNYTVRGLRFLCELYDDNVRYLDAQLRRTFDLLKRHEILAKAVVVVTSDHGEALGEEGFLAHAMGGFLEKVFEVPLIVRGYGVSLRRSGSTGGPTRLVRLADSVRSWAWLDEWPGVAPSTFRRRFNLDPIAVIAAHARLTAARPAKTAGSRPAEPTAPPAASGKSTSEQQKRDEELVRLLKSLGYIH